MIEELFVKNFQSHPDSHLRFSKGVNVIKGETNSGKSALLRTLYWIIEGKPVGDRFRSDWGGDTETWVVVDGNKIGRKRSDDENIYFLNEDIFKSFKTNVPEEVKTALNISEKINIQKQMDSPFLVSKSPGEVGRQLNELVDLQIVDKSLQNIEKKKRRLNQDQKYIEEDLNKTKNFLNELKDLDEWEKQVYDLKESWDSMIEAEEKHIAIRRLIKGVDNKKKELKSLQSISQYSDKIKDLEGVLSFVIKEISDLDKKRKLVRGLQKAKKEHLKNRKEIAVFKENLKNIMPEVCPLCGAINKGEL